MKLHGLVKCAAGHAGFSRGRRCDSGSDFLEGQMNIRDALVLGAGANPTSLRYSVTTFSHPTREFWQIFATAGCHRMHHTRTQTCTHFSLLSPFFFKQTGNGGNKRGSETETAQTPTPAATTAVSHHVFRCFCECAHANVCARSCVCVCACEQVRCVSQDCQHISLQREPYRNRDICGVKGRQLAWPSLERGEEQEEERAGGWRRVSRSYKPCLRPDN